MNVQAEVEQPEVHLLVLSSSTISDQAAIIGDRLESLTDLTAPVKTSGGNNNPYLFKLHVANS